jgi:cysteinyl-tRNA synthetase
MSAPVFFNTLGRRLEPLQTAAPGEVRLYTCGPTVYNHVHIGNLRTFLFEDVLRRSLRYLGYRVTQVMNLTDVDDRTIQGAQAAGVGLAEFTAPFVRSFMADLAALHVEPAEHYPRATEHIAPMIAVIERLLERGYAYPSEGSVWFRIASDPDYGRLSGIDAQEMRVGERVASDDYGKEDARDFVLWKGAKPGEPAWDSPWGPGRPGWHIECSAMSMQYLGESFDVHCGGVDNIFPHHENEIAQSEGATGKPFVRHWLHSEHLLVDGEKMAKRLGNQYTLADLLERGHSPRAVRYLLVSAHYRQKLNFTWESLEAAAGALRRLDEMRFRLRHAAETDAPNAELDAGGERLRRDFAAALGDDLNVSAALAAVFAFVKQVNVAVERGEVGAGDRQRALATLAEADRVLGVLDPDDWRGEARPADDAAEIERRVAAREAARRDRDFALADRLRGELAAMGVVVEDTPQGPRWKRR